MNQFAPGLFEESAHFWTTSPEAKNDFAVEGEVVWIRLTRGKCTCIDFSDWEKVKGRKWYTQKSHKVLYAYTRILSGEGSRGSFILHKLLCGFNMTDHENGNGLDNRKGNLREATHRQNIHNRGLFKRNTSGFIGVAFVGKNLPFCARVRVDNKAVFQKNFKSAEEAARARDSAAVEHFGEFARLNFPVAVEGDKRES